MTQQMVMISGSGSSKNRYRHDEAVTGATSDPVLIENTGSDVLIAVKPGTSATVQFTLSPVAKIKAGTADWYDWPEGTVSVNTQDSVSSVVTALRLVSVGASSWEVVS